MLGAIPDPIFVLDHQGRFTDLKAGNFEWLYVPEVEIHDRTLNEILPADIAEEIQKYIGIVLKNKKTQEFQYKIEVGGELRDYEARISYLDPEHVISLVRDITDQRRAMRSVRQQNNFQKMVADISTAFVKSQVSSLDEIINRCLGQVGEFFEVQRAYIYRYSEDYAYLWKSNEWHCSNCQGVGPKREEYHVSMLPWWNKMILNGKTIKLEKIEDLLPESQPEYAILTKQGIKSILCVPIQSGSRVMGYFGMDFLKEHRQFSDVDTDNFRVIANLLGEVFNKQVVEEHMKSQAQLQEIISRMAMKYINLPSENLEESINHSLRELATFSEADRAYIFDYEWGKGICISYNQWQREGLRTSVPMRKIMPTELIEPWPSIHRSGQAVSYEDVANADLPEPLKLIMEIQEVKSMVTLPLMNQGKCQGFVGFDYVSSKRRINKGEVTLLSLYAQLLVNVRNRRTLESRLIREKDRAEAANKAKSEFLANMSHEIRTPLNGVIGFAELLFNSGLDGAQHQYAKNIVNSSNNLLGILSDILDFSKIEAGKLELAPKKTDLIELVEHATDIIKIRMEQKNLELLLDVEPGLPRYALLTRFA
jgi:GAF domain-containing protein